MLGYWRKRSVVGSVGGVPTPPCPEIVGRWWLSRVSSAGIASRWVELLVLGATNIYWVFSGVCVGESSKSSSSSRVLCEISWGPIATADHVFLCPVLLPKYSLPHSCCSSTGSFLPQAPKWNLHLSVWFQCLLPIMICKENASCGERHAVSVKSNWFAIIWDGKNGE